MCLINHRGLGADIARAHPDLAPTILTGISAGAINAAHLGNHVGRFEDKTIALAELWGGLDVDQVFEKLQGTDAWLEAERLAASGGEESLLTTGVASGVDCPYHEYSDPQQQPTR